MQKVLCKRKVVILFPWYVSLGHAHYVEFGIKTQHETTICCTVIDCLFSSLHGNSVAL